jgi:hypothetical protein
MGNKINETCEEIKIGNKSRKIKNWHSKKEIYLAIGWLCATYTLTLFNLAIIML